MRLQPYQVVFLGLAIFWAGLIIALMLVSGHAQPPESPPFQAPL